MWAELSWELKEKTSQQGTSVLFKCIFAFLNIFDLIAVKLENL